MTAQKPRHSVSVAAAVVRPDGRVLAIKRRDNSKWEPPGGVLEPHEPILEGLVREVWEETGLQVEPGPLSGVYKNVERGIVALMFRCTPRSGQLTVTRESRELKWLSRGEVPGFMDEAYAVRILDAFEEGPAKVRAHDGVLLLSEAGRKEPKGDQD